MFYPPLNHSIVTTQKTAHLPTIHTSLLLADLFLYAYFSFSVNFLLQAVQVSVSVKDNFPLAY